MSWMKTHSCLTPRILATSNSRSTPASAKVAAPIFAAIARRLLIRAECRAAPRWPLLLHSSLVSIRRVYLPFFSPSRLFIWYHAREKSSLPSAVLMNKGCSARNAIKSLNFAAHGVCPEEDWPFEECKFNKKTRFFAPNERAARKPPVRAERHAHDHTASIYYTFTELNLREKLIQCLDSGYPVVFGMKTYGLLSKKSINSDGEGLR
ncbi:hypothetical protein B0H16DRAFT_135303 [Mycena metata]|uniref:Uncharacterized protein n=1 Tax=Mycena metata TaxID=1033252 RepID=A0AAD7MW92_9AGAR|nr:hypothetical protein B0H16DRAFT_135303 [Mycena metata]